jgi:hypothetical protein
MLIAKNFLTHEASYKPSYLISWNPIRAGRDCTSCDAKMRTGRGLVMHFVNAGNQDFMRTSPASAIMELARIQ